MNHTLLVRVVDRLADGNEELNPLPDAEVSLLAVPRDRQAIDILHHEIRQALRRCPGVKDLGDVRMIHQGKGAPFAVKTRDHGL